MPALNLNMTIPLANAGHIRLTIDVPDIDQLTAAQRQVVADTGAEFYAFAAATIAPPDDDEVYEGTPAAAEFSLSELRAELDECDPPPATIHSTDGDVLRGVTGSRRQ